MKKTKTTGDKKKMEIRYKQTANFLFEVGILAKTPRSGFNFLGTGDQSVAEHLNRATFIGYALALLDGTVDVLKVLKMCMLHDISETRISDLNYVHQKYVTRMEDSAVKDITDSVPFGKDMFDTLSEYEERQSKESILAKDADNLEWILALKEEVDTGNTRALEWIKPAIKRLKTEPAQAIASAIMDTDSNDWWFADKNSPWWVNRNKK
ncbi:MAG: HD domain-containing protein [bacterium]